MVHILMLNDNELMATHTALRVTLNSGEEHGAHNPADPGHAAYMAVKDALKRATEVLCRDFGVREEQIESAFQTAKSEKETP